MAAKIRKHQTNLICSGLAVIAFGFWSILRSALFLYFDDTFMASLMDYRTDIPEETFKLAIFCVFFTILVLDLLFRLYVGIAAVREGNGVPRRSVYLVLSAGYLIVSVFADVSFLIQAFSDPVTMEELAALIVDFTSCIALFQMILSALSIRRYQRMGKAAEGGSYAA